MKKCAGVFLMLGGILSVSLTQAEERKYTLQDLQALQGRKAWPELLEHLQDVAPAARTAEWNRVVETACMQEEYKNQDWSESCGDALKSVLEAEPTNTDFAWKAGQWCRQNLQPWFAVPFFSKVIQKGDARCKDVHVQQAITSGLGLPVNTQAGIVKQSQTLAFETCWPDTKASVMAEFSSNSYVQDNACVALKAKGVLSSLQSKRCGGK